MYVYTYTYRICGFESDRGLSFKSEKAVVNFLEFNYSETSLQKDLKYELQSWNTLIIFCPLSKRQQMYFPEVFARCLNKRIDVILRNLTFHTQKICTWPPQYSAQQKGNQVFSGFKSQKHN